MQLIKFIVELCQKYPRYCLVSIFLNIGLNVSAVGSLFSLGPIVDLITHPDGVHVSPWTQKGILIMKHLGLPVSLASWVIVFFLLVSVASLLQVWAFQATFRLKYAVERDVLLESFRDFFNAKWQFFSGSEQGTIYNTFNQELTQFGNAFSAMGSFFSGLIQVFFFLAVPFIISWKVTLIALAVGGAASSVFLLLASLTYKLGKIRTAASNKYSSAIFDSINGAKLVLGYANRDRMLKETDEAFKEILKTTIHFQVLNYAIQIAYRPLGVIVAGVAIMASQWFSIGLSEVAILLLALFQLMIASGNLIGQKNTIINLLPSYEQILALRKKAREMRQPSGQRQFSGFSREVQFDGLSFSHPGHPKVLDGIDLKIPKGNMVALVGKSGAGKSTMIDMLLGFHEPESGSLLIDGINLFEYDITSYRRRLGYVPQESFLFNMSIRNNLLWAAPDASFQDIEEACRQAYADEFIVNTPQKYDTIVGDRGVRLSGGQVQRLALARAFLRKPEILILDEATSSLDSRSEQLIQKAIEKFAKKATVVIVAHRLTTIKRSDIIYVLDKGQVIEQGTYSDLMNRNGAFTGMIQLQELGMK